MTFFSSHVNCGGEKKGVFSKYNRLIYYCHLPVTVKMVNTARYFIVRDFFEKSQRKKKNAKGPSSAGSSPITYLTN